MTEIIRKSKIITLINLTKRKVIYSIFKCPYCENEVERIRWNGLKQKSCGCISKKYGYKTAQEKHKKIKYDFESGMSIEKLCMKYNLTKSIIYQCINKI